MRPQILSVSPALMDYLDSITMVVESAYQLNTSFRPDSDPRSHKNNVEKRERPLIQVSRIAARLFQVPSVLLPADLKLQAGMDCHPP
ncbi:hypothetical protein [Nitrospira sp. Nam80]